MSTELTAGNVIDLFNAIEEVLKTFGMHRESHQAPGELLEHLVRFRQEVIDPAELKRNTPTENSHAGLNDLYRKLVNLYVQARIVRNAPAGIGRSGAGKAK